MLELKVRLLEPEVRFLLQFLELKVALLQVLTSDSELQVLTFHSSPVLTSQA